jgi:hypothetical protein
VSLPGSDQPATSAALPRPPLWRRLLGDQPDDTVLRLVFRTSP